MSTTAALLSTLFCMTLMAQGATQDGEAQFNQRQAQKLNAFAKNTLKKGFPRQAKVIWLQVLKLYDGDNQEAHAALGEKKVGASWAPDPAFKPATDDTGTGVDGGALFKAFEALKKELASAHHSEAEKWAAAGRSDKSLQHYRMVLRWVEDDKKAKEALAYREVGTLSGTELESTLYTRSKKIEQAIEEQSRTDYKVKKVEGEKCEPLEKAQVKYVTMRSDHFTLHGDPGQEQDLGDALRWAERTLEVCKAVLPWPNEIKAWPNDWAFFVGKESYQQILKANAVPELEWRLEHTSTCGIGSTVVGATGSTKVLFDAAVRNVAKGCAGLMTDGLQEGIGHTFVGMMFNNNRLFAVDLKKQQGTTGSEQDREYTSPDFDVWKTLNLELAWKSTGGVPARELPFCEAAKFSNEQRIKAWSFCDYMLRRDPKLLRDMDQLGGKLKKERKTALDFEQAFDAAHEVKLAQLDKEWEDFWTEASSVLKAILNNTPPLAAVSKGVEKWLEVFNTARKDQGVSPVTWSSNLSTRCRDHALYLKQNKDARGPAKEHRQGIDLGGTHLGSMFAEMAIIETGARVDDAKKMFQRWLAIPGYRDALVHDFLLTVGIYSEGEILVMNVVSGLGTPRSKLSGYSCFPRKSAQGIPTEVAMADLGPEVVALLEQHGHKDKKVIGYPLTLHFGQNVNGNRQSYVCKVTNAKGGEVQGAILMDGGSIRRSTAPGMVTFYPFDPLPHGEIEVVWTWDQENGPQRLSAPFKTK